MKQCTLISCLWKKCSKCRKKNYLLQYAHPLSVMEEIRSQGKFLTRNCVKEICQDFQSSWRLQIRWWAIYISCTQKQIVLHTKYLVEPQLREGESYAWTAKPCKQIVVQRPTDQLWKVTKSIKNRRSLENIQATVNEAFWVLFRCIKATSSFFSWLSNTKECYNSYLNQGSRRLKWFAWA